MHKNVPDTIGAGSEDANTRSQVDAYATGLGEPEEENEEYFHSNSDRIQSVKHQFEESRILHRIAKLEEMLIKTKLELQPNKNVIRD